MGARLQSVIRHQYRIKSQILGFDTNGKITNQGLFGSLNWAEIVEISSKIITFIDVSGQKKYTKTMVFKYLI